MADGAARDRPLRLPGAGGEGLAPAAPAVIGHRGAPRRAPENTVASFLAAAGEGATWVELDARRSADDVVMVHHDPVTADGVPLVHQRAGDLARRGLVELGDVLAALPPGLGVNVECKNSPGEPDYDEQQRLAELVARVLAGSRAGADRPLLVSSFNPLLLQAVAECLPGTPTALVHGDGMTVAASIELALELGLDAVCPFRDCADLSAATVAQAHDAGLAVLVWTVNEPARAVELAAAGVDGLCTDDPEGIVTALRSAALKPPR